MQSKVPTDSFDKVFADINKVMVVLAHPDDAEIVCGGVIARLAAMGKTVRLVVTTNGGKGFQEREDTNEKDFSKERVAEQKRAGEFLGIVAEENFNLGIPDGEVEGSLEHIEKVVYHIRQFQPDILITHNPQDVVIAFPPSSAWINHRDHRNTGLITCDAAYPYCHDRGFFPEHFEQGLQSHQVNKILFADSYTKENVLYFETTDYVGQKAEALQNHPSAINPEHAQDYVDENKIGDKYFEPLAYWEIY